MMFWSKHKTKRKIAKTIRPRVTSKHYIAHREVARELIHTRLRYFATKYGFDFNSVRIKNNRRVWGSCSSKRNLNFHYKLLFLPPALTDYVIVHELCHLKEMNHSARFWALVANILPNYKEAKESLRKVDMRSGIFEVQ